MRITLEEAAWELFKSKGSEVLDALSMDDRNVVQMAWGVFPYQQHSFLQIAKNLNLPKSTVYYHYRGALRTIKKTYKISITCL